MSCNSFLQEGRVREMGREVKRYREHSEDAMLNPSFAGYNHGKVGCSLKLNPYV